MPGPFDFRDQEHAGRALNRHLNVDENALMQALNKERLGLEKELQGLIKNSDWLKNLPERDPRKQKAQQDLARIKKRLGEIDNDLRVLETSR